MSNTVARRAGQERRKQRRFGTVSRVLSLLLVASLLLLGLVVALLLSLRMDHVMEAQRQLHADAQARAVAADLDHQLTLHRDALRDHAGFPVILNALMQPETHLGVAADFFDSLTLFGEPTHESLLDFRGQTLVANRLAPGFDYTGMPWVEALLEGRLDHYRGVSEWEDQHFWRLAVPVFHNAAPKGVLIAEVPFDALYRRMELECRIGGLRLELLYDDHLIDVIGATEAEHQRILFSLPGPVDGAELRFRIDANAATLSRWQMLLEIAGLLGLLAFVIAGVTIWLARRWFIAPIEWLQQSMTQLAKGQYTDISGPLRQQGVKELDDLAYGLMRMAKRIAEREDALRTSKEALASALERLLSTQERLLQQEKMASLGTLAAGVAHEINNPIGFIQGNVATLREYMAVLAPLVRDYQALVAARAQSEPELVRAWEARICSEDVDFLLEDLDSLLGDTAEGGQRVARIVDGLRSFAHGGESEDEPTDVNACVISALNLANNAIKYKAEVIRDLGDVPRILGNADQLTQILVNLLVNAAQAIIEHGQITITTSASKTEVCVRVGDTGAGIAPELLGKLFLPFFTTKPVGAGTGLGLSISQGIAERHGGRLEVSSVVGQGSTFTLTLPIRTVEIADSAVEDT